MSVCVCAHVLLGGLFWKQVPTIMPRYKAMHMVTDAMGGRILRNNIWVRVFFKQ